LEVYRGKEFVNVNIGEVGDCDGMILDIVRFLAAAKLELFGHTWQNSVLASSRELCESLSSLRTKTMCAAKLTITNMPPAARGV
jgi:hypothetical protein